MRKSIWITCAIILAICAWLLLHRSTKKDTNISSPTGAILTNQPATKLANQPRQSEAPTNSKSPHAPIADTIPPRPAGGIAMSNWVSQQMHADWQKPIEFYGKVLDENSNGVVGASVRFHWADMSEDVNANTSITQSDTEGLFSLHGKLGRSLHVWVSKEGYYASHGGEESFLYSLGNDIYSPDPMNPVVFKLHTKGKGESLITSAFPTGMGQIAQLHHDGTPVELDLFKGAEVPVGSGQLKLGFWRAITNQNANIYDWKCQLTVPGGGLIETPEEFAFQAPESGYQPSIVIDMPATNQPWKGEIRSKYFIQFPDGKYGRIEFYILPYNGVFTIQSAINPTGSRNLEPSN